MLWATGEIETVWLWILKRVCETGGRIIPRGEDAETLPSLAVGCPEVFPPCPSCLPCWLTHFSRPENALSMSSICLQMTHGAVQSWTGHQGHLPLPLTSCVNLASPCLGLLVCKMGLIMVPPAQKS